MSHEFLFFFTYHPFAGSTLGTSICPLGTAMASGTPPWTQQLPTAANVKVKASTVGVHHHGSGNGCKEA